MPVWFLAEMGLIGLGCYAFFVVALLGWGLPRVAQDANARGLVAAVVLFVLVGLFHDIFYQRTFWFGIGLLLANAFYDSQPERQQGT